MEISLKMSSKRLKIKDLEVYGLHQGFSPP